MSFLKGLAAGALLVLGLAAGAVSAQNILAGGSDKTGETAGRLAVSPEALASANLAGPCDAAIGAGVNRTGGGANVAAAVPAGAATGLGAGIGLNAGSGGLGVNGSGMDAFSLNPGTLPASNGSGAGTADFSIGGAAQLPPGGVTGSFGGAGNVTMPLPSGDGGGGSTGGSFIDGLLANGLVGPVVDDLNTVLDASLNTLDSTAGNLIRGLAGDTGPSAVGIDVNASAALVPSVGVVGGGVGSITGDAGLNLNGGVGSGVNGLLNGGINALLNGDTNSSVGDGVNGLLNGDVNTLINGGANGSVGGSVNGLLNGDVNTLINGGVSGGSNGLLNGGMAGNLNLNGTVNGRTNPTQGIGGLLNGGLTGSAGATGAGSNIAGGLHLNGSATGQTGVTNGGLLGGGGLLGSSGGLHLGGNVSTR